MTELTLHTFKSVAARKEVEDFLIPNPTATFPIKFRGDALKNIGLFDGDLLFIDRSIKPENGHLVLAYLDGHFTVRRLRQVNGQDELHPENDNYPTLLSETYSDYSIEGVVISSCRKYI